MHRLCLGILSLSAPSRIRLSHVRWWLNRWDELGDHICDTDGANDSTDDGGEDTLVVWNGEGADEDVDWL